MAGHGEKLSRKNELAVCALLAQPTVEAAAAEVGVSHRTLKTWLQLPAFRAAYRAARLAVLEQTVGQLAQAGLKAVAVLVEALEAPRAADRIRAAAVILAHAQRGAELADLAEELAELRAEWEESKRGKATHPWAGPPRVEGAPGRNGAGADGGGGQAGRVP
jgi:hypothetical protein